MADDLTYGTTASGVPSGSTIATDDVGDVHFQKVKIDVGGDGASSPVTDIATSAKQDTLLTELQAKADLDETQPISAAALPLPSSASTAANQQAAATGATIFNVTMTNADQEYSQALSANTRRFSLQCLTDFDVRFAFETGKVATPTAPYALVRAGMNYSAEQLNLASVTLYFASPDAGKVAEIICWT